jgi:hypothetical protein
MKSILNSWAYVIAVVVGDLIWALVLYSIVWAFYKLVVWSACLPFFSNVLAYYIVLYGLLCIFLDRKRQINR